MTAHFYESLEGWFWFRNAYDRLLDTLPTDRPSIFVEVGCYHGRSLAYLVVEAERRGIPVQIHAVDLWEDLDTHRQFQENMAPVAGRFTEHWLSSPDAAKHFADASCDVIWLDGDHSEEMMRLELAMWWPKLTVGGWIGGDDWDSGIQPAIIERFGPTGFELGQGTLSNDEPFPWWLVQKTAP